MEQAINALAPIVGLAVLGAMGWGFRQLRKAYERSQEESESRAIKVSTSRYDALDKKLDDSSREINGKLDLAARKADLAEVEHKVEVAAAHSAEAVARLDKINGTIGRHFEDDRALFATITENQARLEGRVEELSRRGERPQ